MDPAHVALFGFGFGVGCLAGGIAVFGFFILLDVRSVNRDLEKARKDEYRVPNVPQVPKREAPEYVRRLNDGGPQ